jgi:uncharacterized protein (DUF1778 family)
MSGSDKTKSSKSSRIDLRVTQPQKELLEKAAAFQGISLSAYTLSHLIPIAQKEISDREKLILDDRDRDLLMSALENPPQLKGKLKEAIKNYQKKYGE